MTVQDLYRILEDELKVELYSYKLHKSVWVGEMKDMPNCFFDNLVSSLRCLNIRNRNYLRINIVD